MTNPAARRIACAMTIDVEDWHHVSAFEGVIDRADWPHLPSRVAANTHRLLDMFADAGARGTFFTLGVVAEAEPALIRRIAAEGHEVASHGWDHRRVFTQDRAAFAADVARAKTLLEDVVGAPLRGYRAASFSITPQTPWAYEVLAETGHAYSSSSHPLTGNRYGCEEGRIAPWRHPSGLLEIPVTTARLGRRRVPGGGGGYFRMLPSAWFRRAARRAAREGLTPNFYLHPWEIDPGQPRVHAAPLTSRFRHYVNLSRTADKLRRHLAALDWDRMDRRYARWLDPEAG